MTEPAGDPAALLEVDGLAKSFGGIRALDGISFAVHRAEIVGLIGPNGSGKTTAFNLISGIVKPSAGRIRFRGHDIAGLRSSRIAALGLARTFQNSRLFRELPVIDNVAVGCHLRHGAGVAATIVGTLGARRSERWIYNQAWHILESQGLADRAAEPVGRLPFGDQRRVELCRALATEPAMLLLDEPSAGMNSTETHRMTDAIETIQREQGVAIVLVEHDMKMVMGVCQRIQVINQGRLLAAGTPREVQSNPDVIAAYLGRRRDVQDAVA